MYNLWRYRDYVPHSRQIHGDDFRDRELMNTIQIATELNDKLQRYLAGQVDGVALSLNALNPSIHGDVFHDGELNGRCISRSISALRSDSLQGIGISSASPLEHYGILCHRVMNDTNRHIFTVFDFDAGHFVRERTFEDFRTLPGANPPPPVRIVSCICDDLALPFGWFVNHEKCPLSGGAARRSDGYYHDMVQHGSIVIARARLHKNRQRFEYSAHRFNCQHFAMLCLTDRAYSPQITGFTGGSTIASRVSVAIANVELLLIQQPNQSITDVSLRWLFGS